MIDLLAGAVAGVGLGLLYFGLLYGTVRTLPLRRHPHRWVMGSFALRIALLALGLLLVGAGSALRLLGALLGLLVARTVLVHRMPGKHR